MTKDDELVWNFVTSKVTPFGSRRPSEPLGAPLSAIVRTRLDLHGMTVQAAYEASRAFLDDARRNGLKSVEIITGKSGQIRKEFPHWMRNNENVRQVEVLKGGGAFLVKVTRPHQTSRSPRV